MNQLVIYQPDDGSAVSVRLEGNTLWLTQRQLAELFATSTDNISLHLKNIYSQGELAETATTEDFSVVQKEGQRSVSRKVKHYNLDAIISVGYRVNSKCGTQFRQWATGILRAHLMQGWTLDRTRFEHEEGGRTAASVRAVIAANIKALACLPDRGDPLSIRDWVQKEADNGGFIFITSNAEQLSLLRPLITLWVDIATRAILGLEPDPKRRIGQPESGSCSPLLFRAGKEVWRLCHFEHPILLADARYLGR